MIKHKEKSSDVKNMSYVIKNKAYKHQENGK